MTDAVDQILDQWARERPDVDAWPIGVMGRFTRLSRLLDREFKVFFGAHGLEFWEFDVLATLRRAGGSAGLTAGALNKAAMVTSGAITNRIDRLATKELVERVPDPEDRRSVRVRLTDKGKSLVDDLLPAHVANEERLLASLSRDDCDRLTDTMRTLMEGLGDTALD